MALQSSAVRWHVRRSCCCLARSGWQNSGTGLCRTAAPLQHSSRPLGVLHPQCAHKANLEAQEDPQQPVQQPSLPQTPQPQFVDSKDLQNLQLKLNGKLEKVISVLEHMQDQAAYASDSVKKALEREVSRLEKAVADVKKDVADVKKDVAGVKKAVAANKLYIIFIAVLVGAIFGYKEVLPFIKAV